MLQHKLKHGLNYLSQNQTLKPNPQGDVLRNEDLTKLKSELRL
jgi:predicted transcriptional regulator